MAMTPRERWRALFDGQRPDRVPCDYWGTEEVTTRLLRELGCGTERQLWERLGVDKCIHLAPAHAAASEPGWHLQSLFSIWHIGTREIPYGEGIGVYTEVASSPLAEAETVAEVEQFDWPDAGLWDVSGIRAECRQWQDYPILCGTYEPFYLYCRLRGMERALEDLIANPAVAEAILARIFDHYEAVIRRILEEAGDLIDLVYVAEDLGTQNSLLMSLPAFRRFLKPGMARMIELVHSYGVKVFHHDDGSIRAVLPELIEIGIDLLNPIQWKCRGMEREGLAADFGSAVVFHGGVDNQQTLPFGTPEDVRREVRDNIAIFKDSKGYIVAPCHNIQSNTPTENIVALYEAVHEYGRLK